MNFMASRRTEKVTAIRRERRVGEGIGMKKSLMGLRPAYLVRSAAVISMVAGTSLSYAQSQEPMDVNAVQPAAESAPAPVEVAQPEADSSSATAEQPKRQDDGPVYAVSSFVTQYWKEHPQQPAVDDLLNAQVEIAQLPSGYAAPGEGRTTRTVRVRELSEGGGGNFHWSGLTAVASAIVKELNARGIIASYVMLPDLSTDGTFTDKREGVTEMRLVIVTGVISENGVRSVARGDRLAKTAEKVNVGDPVHMRVRRQSPLASGDLVNQKKLDEYLFALNRHPGRKIDVALSPGQNEGEANLDYLITENRPWSVYAQVSNTGTESTSLWRERFGFVNNQLTGNDDILRLDYVTGNFDASHAVSASYQFPLLSDRLWVRPYASWSQFEASELGLSDSDAFKGETTSFGGEVIGNVYQKGPYFLDLFGGARHVDTTIEQTAPLPFEGNAKFLIPYIGVRSERFSEDKITLGSIAFEANVNDWADQESDLDSIGRQDTDEFWTAMKFDFEHSFYVEPLMNPDGFNGDSDKGLQTLAHEVSLQLRGQYAFGSRMPAMEQDVAGGFYTVRGYDESATAGDDSIIFTAEYRFHLPRSWKISDPGFIENRQVSMFGGDFRWAPQSAFGRTDWDLILRGFLDAAKVRINDALIGEFDSHTLIGAGFGAELQIRRNFTLRTDLGFVLHEVEEADRTFEPGDARLHFSATVMY